jgi:hypothetical protein
MNQSRVPICSDLDVDCQLLDHLRCYLYDPGKGRCPFLSTDKEPAERVEIESCDA